MVPADTTRHSACQPRERGSLEVEGKTGTLDRSNDRLSKNSNMDRARIREFNGLSFASGRSSVAAIPLNNERDLGEEFRVLEKQAEYAHLVDIIHAVGRPSFYDRLSELIAALFQTDRIIVVRYSRFGPPEFIINTAMSIEAIEFYLSELYRIDPLYHYSRKNHEGTVLTLNHLKEQDTDNPYYLEIHRTALIFDELAILLPAPGNVFLAVCCDRLSGRFSDSELRVAEALFPIVEALHTLHLDQVLRNSISGVSSTSGELPSTMMLLDRNKRLLHESEAWQSLAREKPEIGDIVSAIVDESGLVHLDESRSLHWQKLDESYGVAPSGWICLIEAQSGDALSLDWGSVIERFQRFYELTPREAEITALMTRGYPNELIAQELSISYGNVKNHRHRLYQKLDVSSERELFSLLLHHILAQSAE